MSDQKVALITAGGSGMGAAIARNLADAEYRVAILSSSGKGMSLAEELGGIGLTGSNQNVEHMQSIADMTIGEYGRIDAVVNSAGHGPKGSILEITDEEWHLAMDVYLMNVIRMARIVTPLFETQRGGVIVNISTFAAFEPEPAFPTSCVMRAGLASFCKLYSNEFANRNIRMNNLLPGFIDSLPENAAFRARVPMGRYGTTTEIAETVKFLLSDGAQYITGQNIRVDGGFTRSI